MAADVEICAVSVFVYQISPCCDVHVYACHDMYSDVGCVMQGACDGADT
jgi:hypothetical protein